MTNVTWPGWHRSIRLTTGSPAAGIGGPCFLPQAFAKFCGITWTVAYFSGVSNGAACELEGLSSAFAGLLPHCALSGLLAQRKSEFQSDQPENGQPTEAAECRFGDRRGRLAGRHGARL